MSAVTYLTDEKDWSKALTEAKSLETLRAVVAGWEPFVPDAAAVVDAMDSRSFERWRDGLAIERKGNFAGEEFATEFGCLIIPTALLRATIMANELKVPLGLILIRLQDLGRLAELVA